jgi:CRP-like cAMP-binding protein
MTMTPDLVFNTKTFLSKVGDGRSQRKYTNGQPIFTQGDRADAVFYIQSGKARFRSSPSRARKPWLQCFRPRSSSAKDA